MDTRRWILFINVKFSRNFLVKNTSFDFIIFMSLKILMLACTPYKEIKKCFFIFIFFSNTKNKTIIYFEVKLNCNNYLYTVSFYWVGDKLLVSATSTWVKIDQLIVLAISTPHILTDIIYIDNIVELVRVILVIYCKTLWISIKKRFTYFQCSVGPIEPLRNGYLRKDLWT